ncbi:hypothetical protein CkaCkLH20_03297 [Colletotrichum karsti]|uniref:Uncharacterized protein n=1 Tax=Colletotrichum karsti TaxID=1095194 RepID=A0A9P6IA76_9PEZI|nr:uncharacterized protein CkaCkLH20_03297 [Colletotrichum karsti]KAF9879064.1 hypothetical protein CkaCkLH20_03297 [Colletotrichum karsti]
MATTTTFSTDPALWIFTSLTAGNSHIVTATSRLETILRANRVPFKAIDIATDEKARMLWGRRAGKDATGRVRRLPGLVQEGLVLGDLFEIEEWNEYGELKQHVKIYYDEFTIPNIHNKPKIIKKVYKKKVPAAGAEGEASTSAPAPPAPPAAPPLPKNETYDAAAKPAAQPKPAAAGSSTALPVRSIADEAAAKAKQLRLQSLRDKVHGKKDDKKPEDAATASAETPAEPEKKAETPTAAATEETPRKPSVASATSDASAASKPAGLQSPTSGSWGASITNPDALRETLQSPTSARWKPSDVDKPVTSHMGAQVASASQEEIAAVEKAEAIKEEPGKESTSEESSEDDEKEEEAAKAPVAKEVPEDKKEAPTAPVVKEVPKEKIAEVEKAQAIPEDPKKEEEEAEEEEDDDDEDDSDESDESDDKPETKKTEAPKAETKGDATTEKAEAKSEDKAEAKAEEKK